MVGHGVHPKFFEEWNAGDLAHHLALISPLKRPYLLCIAFSYPHKNIPLLLKAFRLLLDRIPHQLILVGGIGLGEGEVRKIWKTLPRERVLRLSKVSREDVILLMKGADIFVTPSLYEGFGLPVLESMAAGIPVVTTALASFPEIAGGHAVFFDEKDPQDLAQKVRDVLAWPASRRREIVDAGRRRAREFTWDLAAEKTYACFQEILRRSGKAAGQGVAAS